MKAVATPFAKGTKLAKAKDDDASLEVATVAEIVEDSKKVAALADAQSKLEDPLGLDGLFPGIEEVSSCDEEGNTSSSGESMDDIKDALRNPAAAKESQRQQRRVISLLEAPAPPHSMVAAAKRAAEPADSPDDAVMVRRSIDSEEL